MTKIEIFYNEKIKNYTLKEEIKGIKSIKKIPLKFKVNDKTSKFRVDLLRTELE